MQKSTFKQKWGPETSSVGFTPFPSTLLFAQAELGLTPIEMNIILNLLVHWWEKDKYPYPSQKAIAYRMGVSSRTVQRTLLDLEEKKLIIRQRTSRENKVYRGRNIYNLEPLIETLKILSPRIKGQLQKDIE
ncbi:helix-turn-helix domain-containing protein [Acinetobacter pittii]|uniref:helix-turn-helix domain-containing protein n=1 Tax=Acinetobacter pittii TaxID=48296 RepID=UPI000A336A5A|nr:helix-turn-helix domain-containing protein [Acinetobacter pittii]OTM21479.1 helix-turn-helix domain-containing protein [Acinetobacter pittii]